MISESLTVELYALDIHPIDTHVINAAQNFNVLVRLQRATGNPPVIYKH